LPPEDPSFSARYAQTAGCRPAPSSRRMLPNSDSACSKLSSPAPALTITTMSEPGCNFARCSRKNSRTSRFARFRSTDPPTLRLAVIPRRVSLVVPGIWSTRKCRLALPRLVRWILKKSRRDRTRRARVRRKSVLPPPGFGRSRHRKPMAAFGTTAFDYQAATRSGHTGSETMTATPSQIAGLIRSFHGSGTSGSSPLGARGRTPQERASCSGTVDCQCTGRVCRPSSRQARRPPSLSRTSTVGTIWQRQEPLRETRA
jgi:hypothetical protein